MFGMTAWPVIRCRRAARRRSRQALYVGNLYRWPVVLLHLGHGTDSEPRTALSAATACTASLRSLPLKGANRWSWPAVANSAECRLGAEHGAARTDCPF